MTSGAQPRTHRAHAAKRCVVAVRASNEGFALVVVAGGDKPSVLESRNGGGSGESEAVDAAARHKALRIVRVVPAGQTIVKGVLVPDAGADETSAALSLQAESLLPAALPSFRRVSGRVPDTGRPAGRLALVTGWRTPVPPGQENHKKSGVRTTHVAEAAALAFLRGPGPGVALSADPATGSITVVGAGAERVVARSLVEGVGAREKFLEAAEEVAGEASQYVGVLAPTLPGPGGSPFVVLPADSALSLPSRAPGASGEKTWINRFGLALGAALAAVSEDTTESSLAELSERVPDRNADLVARSAEWLAKPNHWSAVIVASLAVLLLGPWALAKGRMLVLESKSAGLGDRSREFELATKREAMYKQLEVSRWPMTKLLSDVSRAAPVGVTVETLSLSPDQGLAIQGSANSPETMNQFLANLNATRVFTGTRINRQETGTGGVDFQLSAGVASPHSKSAAGEDFATKPLAVRLYGEGASNTTTPVSSGESHRTERAPARTTRDNGSSRTEPSERSSSSGSSTSSSPSASSGELPPPLTDEQIGAMTRTSAMMEMVKRRTYPQKNKSIDAATKARLEDEVKRLQDQMQKLNTQPAPGGGAK
jgi:Tfp pilus assembly protein PilN